MGISCLTCSACCSWASISAHSYLLMVLFAGCADASSTLVRRRTIPLRRRQRCPSCQSCQVCPQQRCQQGFETALPVLPVVLATPTMHPSMLATLIAMPMDWRLLLRSFPGTHLKMGICDGGRCDTPSVAFVEVSFVLALFSLAKAKESCYLVVA